MKYDIIQIIGMLTMGIAAATGIRILLDASYVAWLASLPTVETRLILLGIMLVLGIAVTTWAHKRASALGRTQG